MNAQDTGSHAHPRTLWHRAAAVFTRIGDAAMRAQQRKALAALDCATLKDIGWPCTGLPEDFGRKL
ncbi:MAG: hypothetical protein MUC58_04190 [Rhizobiaceae bacterium]|jgi:uncharacterized protein YjiS (DUF1127 family)|nr:hypothetical protein [Rhizobiaceae bacterium]